MKTAVDFPEKTNYNMYLKMKADFIINKNNLVVEVFIKIKNFPLVSFL